MGRCVRCGNSEVRPSSRELAVAREFADVGVDMGEAFRRMRKALGLRATDLAQLLDLTPETISHWETGKVVINRAAFVALGAMVQDAIDGRTTTPRQARRPRQTTVPEGPLPQAPLGASRPTQPPPGRRAFGIT